MEVFALQYQPGVLLVQSNFILFLQYSHTELLVSSQEYNTELKHLSACAVHRVPLHKSTKILAFKCTSTKRLFLISVLHYSRPKSKFQFWHFKLHLHVSANREGGWK